MNIHKLKKERHKDFLSQERIDPVTGDLLEANDKIVICGACDSAFLVDSWKYIGKKHCNQSSTLKQIPKNELLTIDKVSISLNVNIEVETVPARKAIEEANAMIALPFYIVFFLFFLINGSNSDLAFLPILFYFVSYFFSWIITNYEKSLHLRGKFISFKKNKDESKILLSSLKNVRCYKPTRYWFTNLFKTKSNKRYTLEFTLDNDKKHKVLLTKKTIDEIKEETNLFEQFNKSSIESSSIDLENLQIKNKTSLIKQTDIKIK